LTLGFTLMFALNEESLANHIGERKSRLAEEDAIRLEAEKAKEREELEKMAENEAEDMRDINVVQVGQVINARKKHLKDGSQMNDT